MWEGEYYAFHQEQQETEGEEGWWKQVVARLQAAEGIARKRRVQVKKYQAQIRGLVEAIHDYIGYVEAYKELCEKWKSNSDFWQKSYKDQEARLAAWQSKTRWQKIKTILWGFDKFL